MADGAIGLRNLCSASKLLIWVTSLGAVCAHSTYALRIAAHTHRGLTTSPLHQLQLSNTAPTHLRHRSTSPPSLAAHQRSALVEPTDDVDVETMQVDEDPSEDDNRSSTAGWSTLLLNAVTIIWGTQHAVIKVALEEGCSPATVNAVRFAVAAALLTIWTPSASKAASVHTSLPSKGVRTGELDAAGGAAGSQWALAGAELGLWTFLGFALQSVGLLTTTVSRSAFLLYLNVKLVPAFSFVLNGRRSAWSVWAGAAAAVAGTCLLCGDGSPPNIGDAWSLAAAAASAMYILRLEKHASTCNPALLSRAALWTTAFLCAIWVCVEAAYNDDFDPQAVLQALTHTAPQLAYLSIVATACTTWLQAVGQRVIPAERAALIYAMDPVYAAIFAYLFLGETLGPQGVVGAGMISIAAILNQMYAVTGRKGQERRTSVQLPMDDGVSLMTEDATEGSTKHD